MMSKKMNTRAAIGATFTWVVAFSIIFFVMLLFVTGSIVVSKTKRVDFRVDFSDLEGENYNLEGQRASMALLNSKIENVKIKNYLIENITEYENEEYNKLFNELVNFFKDSNLLWRVYVYNPGEDYPIVLTKDEWRGKSFDCNQGSPRSEFILLNSDNEQVTIITHICEGKIMRESISPVGM